MKFSFAWEHFVVLLIALAWLIREILWYQKFGSLTTELELLNSDKETLIFRLNIDESSRYVCDESNYNFTSTYLPDTTQKLQSLNLQSVPMLYDWFGLIFIAGICSLISFENYYLHEINRPEDINGEVAYKQILLKVNEFVLKRHPILTSVVFIVVAMLTPLAWVGIFDRIFFVNCTLKVILSFCNASLLFFVAHNGRRLIRYFPRDSDEWRLSLLDWNWWLWVVSRLLGVYDLASGTATALWMGSVMWYVWPFRYFFYYSATTCPSGLVSAISSGAVHAQELAQRGAVSVFLVNMVGHSSLLAACCFLLYLLVIIPPLPATAPLHSNLIMRMWSVVQRWSENSMFVAALSMVSVCNSLLALFRVAWFVFLSSPCGFYAGCVSWMFVHAHIGMSVWALPVVNALMQRSAVIQAHRDQFATHFRDETVKASSAEDATPVSGTDAEAIGTELFDNVLILSTLFFVFVQPYVKTEQPPETETRKTDGQEQEEVKLVDVFQGLLKAEMLAQTQAAQDPPPVDKTEGEQTLFGESRDGDYEDLKADSDLS
jgi:hypothetical protein